MSKVIYFLVVVLLNSGEGARILGAVFTPSYSHQVVFQPIWRELSLRGHQVTVLTSDPMKDPSLTNLTEIDLSGSYDIMKAHNTDVVLSNYKESTTTRIKKYMDALHEVAEWQLAHPEVQKLIHNTSEHFDLLIVEVIFPTQMAFAWRFQVPFIGLVSLDAPQRIHDSMGNPTHPALYPDYTLPFDKNLTFKERLVSTIISVIMTLYAKYRLHPREDATVKKYFGDGVPSLYDLERNMSLLFINSNRVFHFPRPLGPATIQIGGGIHLEAPKPLPDDVASFLDSATDGFVYFSLGSNVKSAAVEERVKQGILQTFAELPYKVLWKFEEEDIAGKPANVKIVQWVPQTAVLAHPNIKAFVTQGGLQSIEEAIFYNVPMVGMPFYGDQLSNVKILETKGLGVRISSSAFTAENLKNAIIDVATNPKYRETLREIADLYNDEEMSGLDKAIWWSEYVIRHKGAAHLRSPAIDIPLYQYYCLDIIALILAVISTIIYLFIKLLQFTICRLFVKKGKKKTD